MWQLYSGRWPNAQKSQRVHHLGLIMEHGKHGAIATGLWYDNCHRITSSLCQKVLREGRKKTGLVMHTRFLWIGWDIQVKISILCIYYMVGGHAWSGLFSYQFLRFDLTFHLVCIYKREMGTREEEYLPVMAMVLLEFIYAVVNIWNRQALLGGLPASVFVFYKQVCATLVTSPVAYFSRSSYLLIISVFLFLFYTVDRVLSFLTILRCWQG